MGQGQDRYCQRRYHHRIDRSTRRADVMVPFSLRRSMPCSQHPRRSYRLHWRASQPASLPSQIPAAPPSLFMCGLTQLTFHRYRPRSTKQYNAGVGGVGPQLLTDLF
jgi:hypothetical protein